MSTAKRINPNLGANDPYQKMDRHQTRPSHIANSEQNHNAKTHLQDAEQSATQNKPSATARAAERFATTHPINKVVGRSNSPTNQNSSRFSAKNPIKGKGPLAFILFLLLGGGALFLSGQSILGPHIAALYTEATDIQFTSYSLRNQRLFSYMLDGGDQIKRTAFSEKFLTFTPYMKSRLAKNGIEVGQITNGVFSTDSFTADTSRVLRYNGEIITATAFQSKYANDVNFREAYYQAKRGRVAGYFDDSSERVYKRLGISRNLFNDYKSTGDPTQDTQNYKNTMSTRLTGTDTNINTARHETDDDGNRQTVQNGADLDPATTSGDTPQTKARSFVIGLASKASTVGGGACTILRVADMASIAALVTTTFNSINYYMGMMENIDKMKSGLGDESAINDVLNFFTTSTTNELTYTDSTGNLQSEFITGSPLESSGARIILGGVPAVSYQAEAYSASSIPQAATRTILTHGATIAACSGTQAAGAIVSLAATAVPGGTLAKVFVAMLAETVGGVAITGAVAAVVSAIVPGVANAMFVDVLEDKTGIPGGDFFTMGASEVGAKIAQSGSGYTPGNASALISHAHATNTVLAQQAEIDRLHANPFDATNPNTFLGNLASGFLPLLSNSSAVSPLSTLANLTANSFAKLLPSASATNTITFNTTHGNCPELNADGVECTAYGTAIPTTDLSTTNTPPDDEIYERTIMRNMNPDGETIIDNSELAKFITFCAERESPWGITDANILNRLQTDYGVILNNLPFLNDVVSLVNAAEDTANLDWARGTRCYQNDDNPYWDSEYKYYQRFIEDVRILGQMDAYGEDPTPIDAFLDSYYTKNPLDDSYEGYLARITGMTKNDIAFLLEFYEYSQYLANYDPKTRQPFRAETLDPFTSQPSEQISYSVTSEQGITRNLIVYADTRNRSHAA